MVPWDINWTSVNSSSASAAYIHQRIGSVLIQIMACRLFGSHYLNQCFVTANGTFRNKLQWNFNQNATLFIHKNASENIVCEMAAILSRGRWVNYVYVALHHVTTCCWWIDEFTVICLSLRKSISKFRSHFQWHFPDWITYGLCSTTNYGSSLVQVLVAD